MNKAIIILLVLVALFIGQIIIERISRKRALNKLYELISKKEFSKFEELINQKKTIRSLGVFNSEYLKLNIYKMQKRDNKIDSQISFINKNVNMSKKQKQIFYEEAFGYYVTNQKKNEAHQYLTYVNDNCNEYTYKKCKTLYDIVIKKDTSHLDTLLEEIKDSSLSKNILLEKYSLIIKIYENLNDNKNVKHYQALIKDLLK